MELAKIESGKHKFIMECGKMTFKLKHIYDTLSLNLNGDETKTWFV